MSKQIAIPLFPEIIKIIYTSEFLDHSNVFSLMWAKQHAFRHDSYYLLVSTFLIMCDNNGIWPSLRLSDQCGWFSSVSGYVKSNCDWCKGSLTLSALMAIFRFLQTIQIQVSQLVTSCLTWNLFVSNNNISKLLLHEN